MVIVSYFSYDLLFSFSLGFSFLSLFTFQCTFVPLGTFFSIASSVMFVNKFFNYFLGKFILFCINFAPVFLCDFFVFFCRFPECLIIITFIFFNVNTFLKIFLKIFKNKKQHNFFISYTVFLKHYLRSEIGHTVTLILLTICSVSHLNSYNSSSNSFFNASYSFSLSASKHLIYSSPNNLAKYICHAS